MSSDTSQINAGALSPDMLAGAIAAAPVQPTNQDAIQHVRAKNKGKRKTSPRKQKTAKRAQNKAVEDLGKRRKDTAQARKSSTIRSRKSVTLDSFSADDELIAVINDPSVKHADRIRAITLLKEHQKEEAAKDVNSRVDPAGICAYLARCNLYGQDPAAVMLQRHGLKQVAKALCKSLKLAHISLTLGDQTVEHTAKPQQNHGVPTDSKCIDGGCGNPEAHGGDPPHPPGAD